MQKHWYLWKVYLLYLQIRNKIWIQHTTYTFQNSKLRSGLRNFIKYTARVQIDAWKTYAVLKNEVPSVFEIALGKSNWDLRRHSIICLLVWSEWKIKKKNWIFTGVKETRNSAGILFQEQREHLGDLFFSKTLWLFPKHKKRRRFWWAILL